MQPNPLALHTVRDFKKIDSIVVVLLNVFNILDIKETGHGVKLDIEIGFEFDYIRINVLNCI